MSVKVLGRSESGKYEFLEYDFSTASLYKVVEQNPQGHIADFDRVLFESRDKQEAERAFQRVMEK